MSHEDLLKRLLNPINEDRCLVRLRTEAATALAAADARIAELEATVIDDALAIGRSANACMDMMNQRDEARTRAETAETLLDEARRALAPFIRLADNVFSDGKNATVADEVTLWCFNDTDITFGDLRRVRATLDRIGK